MDSTSLSVEFVILSLNQGHNCFFLVFNLFVRCLNAICFIRLNNSYIKKFPLLLIFVCRSQLIGLTGHDHSRLLTFRGIHSTVCQIETHRFAGFALFFIIDALFAFIQKRTLLVFGSRVGFNGEKK